MLWKYRHPASDTSAQPDFTKRSTSGSQFGKLLEKSPPLSDVAESGTGTTEKDWPILKDLGFQEVPCINVDAVRTQPDKQALATLGTVLRTYGPLWCAGYFFDLGRNDTSKGGHVIVLTGAGSEKVGMAVQPVVFFNDPASTMGGTKDKRKLLSWFRKALFNTGDETEGVSPLWYLPANPTAKMNWAKVRDAITSGKLAALNTK